jgi:hypothetical protein
MPNFRKQGSALGVLGLLLVNKFSLKQTTLSKISFSGLVRCSNGFSRRLEMGSKTAFRLKEPKAGGRREGWGWLRLVEAALHVCGLQFLPSPAIRFPGSTVRCQEFAPPASVPAYTYFQNLMIQAAHFSYPEAFALAGKEGGQTLDTAL